MKCKCRYCQTSLDTKNAYFQMFGKNKAYFCSEEHCNLLLEAKEQTKIKKAAEKEAIRQKKQEEKAIAVEKYKKDNDKVYYLICEIIGRKEIVNTRLWKEWALWNKVATNERIGQYLEENKDYLVNVVSRIDDNESARIAYLSAIIKNNLGDYKPRVAIQEITAPKIQEEHYETKFKLKQRRSLEDLEDDCDE